MATESWPEWAVKNIWPQVQDIEKLHKYMPDSLWEKKWPDREFFWSLIQKLIPEWTNQYHQKVVDSRRDKKVKPPKDKKFVAVTIKWLEKLELHDYHSRSKQLIPHS